MAEKSQHKYERPAKVRATKVKHPKGFGTDKERSAKKQWYEVKCGGVLHKGTKSSMLLIAKKCGVKNDGT